MGRLSTMAGIGAAVLALSGEEADAQFGCRVRIHDRWLHRSYIPFGYAGPMVVLHRGIPVGGNYFGGYLSTGNLHIDFSSYEVMPQPVFYPAPVVRGYVGYQPVHYRPAVPYEEMTARHYPRGVTEEDGEDALYHSLDSMREPFRWKKYVKARDGEFLQVDAIIGRKILDVVPAVEEAERRSRAFSGYEYIPVIANDFDTVSEIEGAVRQAVRR